MTSINGRRCGVRLKLSKWPIIEKCWEIHHLHWTENLRQMVLLASTVSNITNRRAHENVHTQTEREENGLWLVDETHWLHRCANQVLWTLQAGDFEFPNKNRARAWKNSVARCDEVTLRHPPFTYLHYYYILPDVLDNNDDYIHFIMLILS